MSDWVRKLVVNDMRGHTDTSSLLKSLKGLEQFETLLLSGGRKRKRVLASK